MVSFCLPNLIIESTCDGFLIGIGRNFIMLGAAIRQLSRLPSGELLKRGKGFLIFRTLAINLLTSLASGMVSQPVKKFPTIRREEADIGVDGDGGLQQCRMLMGTEHEILCRRFLISGFVEGTRIHVGLVRKVCDIQVEFQSWFEECQGMAEHRIRSQVKAGGEGKERPDQNPILIKKIGFVSM